MDHKLSVVVQVDVDGRYVHLLVTGCLTERNHTGLPPLVERARALAPGAAVDVDLTRAHHVDPGGLERLRRCLDPDDSPGPGGPVRLLTRPAPFGLPVPGEPFLPTGPWSDGGRDGVAA